MKETNCDELLQQGYSHIPKELYSTCGILSENDDGESFSDISCASTEKIQLLLNLQQKNLKETKQGAPCYSL